MKIGLVDVDCHASKKKWGATVYTNLAIAKISAYHKQLGDDVSWALPNGLEHYDIVYISKIFNFSPDVSDRYDADKIIKGGTGYSLTSELPEEIDDMQPDFSIYPGVSDDVSFGFLTRGCPNKCAWCVVPKKEGAIRPYWDIERVANGRKKVVLMDNNILASGDYAKQQLQKIIDLGLRVDFNQALDARLMTDEYAQLLAKIKWIDYRIRFGCDTRKQVSECMQAIDMINSYGYKGQFFLYTMLTDNFSECYDRLMFIWRKNHILRQNKQNAIYPCAQPFRDPVRPNVVPQWQKDMAGWVNKRMLFEKIPFEDFEPRKGFKCKEYVNELYNYEQQ